MMQPADVDMAASKLDIGQDVHEPAENITSTAYSDCLHSGIDDTMRESDVPAPPYSTWPTAEQEEADQRAKQRDSGACSDLHVNVNKGHLSETSSGDESAVAALSARSTRLSKNRRRRRKLDPRPDKVRMSVNLVRWEHD